jgi:hypothetical protein
MVSAGDAGRGMHGHCLHPLLSNRQPWAPPRLTVTFLIPVFALIYAVIF